MTLSIVMRRSVRSYRDITRRQRPIEPRVESAWPHSQAAARRSSIRPRPGKVAEAQCVRQPPAGHVCDREADSRRACQQALRRSNGRLRHRSGQRGLRQVSPGHALAEDDMRCEREEGQNRRAIPHDAVQLAAAGNDIVCTPIAGAGVNLP